MNNSALYMLSPKVEFIPVTSLDAKTRRRFHYEEDDVIVAYTQSRNASKIINKDLAALLQQFATPITWAEGIFSFSTLHKKNPQAVAEESYALLTDMHEHGFLILYLEKDYHNADSVLQVEDRFNQYTIVKKIRVLNDTEVYKIKDDAGRMYALKLLKQADAQSIPNEIKMLEHLDGKINTRLVESGRMNDVYFLISEWFESLTSEEEAAKFRNYWVRDNVLKMLNLCIGILQTYRYLHRQTILHADVHPNNILVSEKGEIKLTDFSASLVPGGVAPEREGIGFYFEPELAEAILTTGIEIAPTGKGEQFCIAAVLYHLIAGRNYVDFSAEKEKMYEQIVHEPPVAFHEYDFNLPASLEAVFSKALSKNPADRFESLDDFISAISEVKGEVLTGNQFFSSHNKQHSEEAFVQFVIDTFGWHSPLLQNGFSSSPSCSVNYGASGIAYLFYRLAILRQDADLLHLSDVWANHSLYPITKGNPFFAPDIDITVDTVGKRAVYHSVTGVHLVQTLISYAKNDGISLHNALQNFLSAANEPCDKIDVATGKCGILIACAILLQTLQPADDFELSAIAQLAGKIMKEVWEELEECSFNLLHPNKVYYFGAAHGWSGILYATLFWCAASKQSLPKQFMNRAEQLLACAANLVNTLCWPVSLDEIQPWSGWCNGSAGHVFLWTLLYKQSGDKKFLETAERVALHSFENVRANNVNLCCGTAGQAYAALNLFNATGDDRYLEEAKKIRKTILRSLALPSERPMGLYKGLPGAALLLCELQTPSLARMPLFE